MGYRRKNRPVETTIKVTGESHEKVDEITDRILELYRCIVSPVRDGDRGTVFVYLTVIGEAAE